MKTRRNPGPTGGYHLLLFFHHILPWPVFRGLLWIGSFVALLNMSAQRHASREYLRACLRREPRWLDLWWHFSSFSESLVLRLVAGSRKNARFFHPTGHGDELMALMRSGRQVLYGTFHIGCSDLMGFCLADGFCPIAMIRLRVGNSHDVERFMRNYQGRGLEMIWVSKPDDLILQLNAVIQRGQSIAMQCDRAEYASRTADFAFLGARRTFPITIYHLSAIYRLPVAFCFSFNTPQGIVTHAPRIFTPEGSKQDVLREAKIHFQEVLTQVESLLQQYPYQWFNFEGLNPIAEPEAIPARAPLAPAR